MSCSNHSITQKCADLAENLVLWHRYHIRIVPSGVGAGARVQAHLTELEAALGYGFARRELLVRALTHRSLANERVAGDAPSQELWSPETPGDNERLEFLGDAVLGLVVAEELFKGNPRWHEGELTRVRAQLVSRKHMAEVAISIGLGRHLRLSRGEDRVGLRSKGKVLSNSMEAVLGAMFLDGGLDPVREFARRSVMSGVVEQLAEELRSGAALGNFKSALQEFAQSAQLGTPIYQVKSESGPDHRKRFLVEVRLKTENGAWGQPLAQGNGSTKKLAEQDAARRALEGMKAGEIGFVAAASEWEEPAAE
jgi:ribonuclease III